jgi:hypothetical protein
VSEMLTGQAKVDYQREYMRRRRAGEGKPPKAEREPTRSELRSAKYYLHNNHNRLSWKLDLVAYDDDVGVVSTTDVAGAVRILREHRAELRAKKKARAFESDLRAWDWAAHADADENGWEYSAWPRRVFRCMFCDATSDKAKMSGNGVTAISLDCARESVRILESNEPV